MKHYFLKSMTLALGLFAITACSSSDEEGGDFTEWFETGGGNTTIRKDLPTDDVETYIGYVAKLENLKLQTIKLFSNNWDGELFCGEMDKADPSKVYSLMTELLDNRSRYEQAGQQLEQSGVLSNVTTRGAISSTFDFIYSLTQVASDDEDLIKDALERTKMMGDSKAQQQLFDALPGNCRDGYSSASQWFRDFNNGKLTNKAHQIKNAWYEMTGEVNDATMQFHENLNAVTKSEGNAKWGTAAKVTKELADKGMNVSLSTLDEATGGGISKMSDVNTVMEEVSKLRQKMKDGKLQSSDLAKLKTVIGKNLAEMVLGQFLSEEAENMSEAALDRLKSELSDYVYEKELEKAEEDAAKGTSKSIVQILNNTGTGIGSILAVAGDGLVNVALPNKDGDASVLTDANKTQTVTTTTTDGQRATQQTTPKAGKNELDAAPAPESVTVETDPTSLTFSSGYDEDYIDVVTNVRYMRVKASEGWMKVRRTGDPMYSSVMTVIVTVEENTTGKDRTGNVVMEFSQDGTEVTKTVSIPVTQKAEDKSAGDLSFIDTNNLSIAMIYSRQLGISGFNVGYSMLGYDDAMHIPASKISVNRINDKEYEVKGRYDNLDGYHIDVTDHNPDLQIEPSQPYGVYYDISFKIVAAEPITYTSSTGDTYVVEPHNFVLKDIKVKGYEKDTYLGDADRYTGFDWTISTIGAEAGWNIAEGREALLSKDGLQSGGFSSRATYVARWWQDNGNYVDVRDEDGNVTGRNWVEKWEMYSNSETKDIDDIEIILKW